MTSINESVQDFILEMQEFFRRTWNEKKILGEKKIEKVDWVRLHHDEFIPTNGIFFLIAGKNYKFDLITGYVAFHKERSYSDSNGVENDGMNFRISDIELTYINNKFEIIDEGQFIGFNF